MQERPDRRPRHSLGERVPDRAGDPPRRRRLHRGARRARDRLLGSRGSRRSAAPPRYDLDPGDGRDVPMRVNGHQDESGAVAVMVAILLVVMVGMLALTVDGGLLWTKFRAVRTSTDAATLAAAYSCATGEGLAGAEAQATGVATANVADATNVEPNEYPEGCEIAGGQGTVHYGGQQELMFGPAIGIGSPKPVLTEATAIWGGAGGAENVGPLMLGMQRLSTCG